MTAHDVIIQAQELGMKVEITSNKQLSVSAPTGVMTTEIQEQFKAFREPIITLLSESEHKLLEPATNWERDCGWIMQISHSDLPITPFQLSTGAWVVDVHQFLKQLKYAVIRGESGPRAKWGAIQHDCKQLKVILGEERRDSFKKPINV